MPLLTATHEKPLTFSDNFSDWRIQQSARRHTRDVLARLFAFGAEAARRHGEAVAIDRRQRGDLGGVETGRRCGGFRVGEEGGQRCLLGVEPGTIASSAAVLPMSAATRSSAARGSAGAPLSSVNSVAAAARNGPTASAAARVNWSSYLEASA
jgi:hypothetical protein